MESPWDENPSFSAEAEWSKISTEFTNTGYREGITAGKESALQEGFDDGFAHVGAPIGRELGAIRGMASALLSFITSQSPETPEEHSLAKEARDVVSQLSSIRFTDIAPRDLEAEEHARQHLEDDDAGLDVNEELAEKRKMEGLEDMLARLTAGSTQSNGQRNLSMDDVTLLKGRLDNLALALGLTTA